MSSDNARYPQKAGAAIPGSPAEARRSHHPVDTDDIVTAQFEGAHDTVALTLHDPPFDALQRAWCDLSGFLVDREVLPHARSQQQGVGRGRPVGAGDVRAVHPVGCPDAIRHGAAPPIANAMLVRIAPTALRLEVHEVTKLGPDILEHVDPDRASPDLKVVLEPHRPPALQTPLSRDGHATMPVTGRTRATVRVADPSTQWQSCGFESPNATSARSSGKPCPSKRDPAISS